MTTSLMLRIASLIALLFAVAHSLAGLSHWSPVDDNAVLRAMASTHFDVMGFSRSYLDLYDGLGWSASVAMLLESVLLWQLGSLAKGDAARVRPMIAAFAVAALANGLVAWFFIFAVPAIFSAVLLAALVGAWLAPR
jgi:hypothetical protein